MYPVWVIFLLFGFSGLKDCTSCCSWQAQSIQLSLQQRVGDSAEELSQLLQVRFKSHWQDQDRFLDFFWLFLDGKTKCTQESPASHEWITCDVWEKTLGQIRCIPPRWATVSAFVRCDWWLVCDHVAVERCGTAQVANVSHVRCLRICGSTNYVATFRLVLSGRTS